MTAAAAKSNNIWDSIPARRLVVFIAALAFAFQSFVTQTHIHGEPQGLGGILKIADQQAPLPGKAPVDKGRADCPLCQAIVHAGAFVTPSAPLLYLPFTWIEMIALEFTTRGISHTTAHDWQSRAPPRI